MSYLGEFEQLILFAILKLGDEAYGVPILEAIEERTGREVSSGAMYTALGRMEDRGLVVSRVGEPIPGRGGRPRKYYRLEPAGARALHETVSVVRTMSQGLMPELESLAAEAGEG